MRVACVRIPQLWSRRVQRGARRVLAGVWCYEGQLTDVALPLTALIWSSAFRQSGRCLCATRMTGTYASPAIGVVQTAQLDLTIEDRFGHPVKPREWFLVPLHVIDEAVERIRDGSITDVVYAPDTARLVG